MIVVVGGKQFLTALWTCQSFALKRVTDIICLKNEKKNKKNLTLRTCFDIYFTGTHSNKKQLGDFIVMNISMYLV